MTRARWFVLVCTCLILGSGVVITVVTASRSAPRDYTCEDVARSTAKTRAVADELLPRLRGEPSLEGADRGLATEFVESECAEAKPDDKPYDRIVRQLDD